MDEDEKLEEAASEELTNLSDAILRAAELPPASNRLLSIADALHSYRKQSRCLMDQLTHAVNLSETVENKLGLSDIINVQSCVLDIVQQVRDDSLVAFSSQLAERFSIEGKVFGAAEDKSLILDIAEQAKNESLTAFSAEFAERVNAQLGLSDIVEAGSPVFDIVDQMRSESFIALADNFSEIVRAQLESPSILAAEASVLGVVEQLKEECLIFPATDLSGIVSSQADLLSDVDIQSSVLGIVDRLQEESLVSLSNDLSAIVSSQLDLLGLLDAHSPVVDALQAANHSIGRLFDMTDSINERAIGMPWAVSPVWLDQVREVIPTIEPSLLLNTSLQPHLARISELSATTQASAACVPWNEIGNAIQIGDSVRAVIQDNFLELAGAYSAFFHSLEHEAAMASLPPVASGLPPVELLNETNLMGTITIGSDDYIRFVNETQVVRSEIQAETDDRLCELLSEVDQELIALLQGARHALHSDHPDNVRHFATSFRELFTHVLHTLAPDEAIRKWSSDHAHYHQNRPTRKARLLYICRSVNHGPFTRFIEQDIKAILEFLQLFQHGTHRVASGYTGEQLAAMSLRMESSLRFILEIGRVSKI